MATEIESWDDDGIELRSLLLALWAGRYWVIGATFVCALIAGAIAFSMTPFYRATTVLVPASGDRSNLSNTLGNALGSLGGLASLAGIGLSSGDAATEEALAVLKSRQFTEKFIREYELLDDLYPQFWDAKAGKWDVPPEKVPSYAKASKFFDERVRSTVRDKKTGLITLHVTWSDRTKAAQWANAQVDRLNSEMRGRAVVQSDASLGYLEKELAKTTQVETREAINRLVEAQIRERMLANVSQEYVFRVVDRALTPDLIDKVRPQKVLMMLIGALLGGALASAWVVVRALWRGQLSRTG